MHAPQRSFWWDFVNNSAWVWRQRRKRGCPTTSWLLLPRLVSCRCCSAQCLFSESTAAAASARETRSGARAMRWASLQSIRLTCCWRCELCLGVSRTGQMNAPPPAREGKCCVTHSNSCRVLLLRKAVSSRWNLVLLKEALRCTGVRGRRA